ncbi:MAG: hypothetical protein AABO58_25115 [Acidobacteriota bacterium]
MRNLFAAALLSVVALSALAQKTPPDELGFHPEKLYDFSNIDSVNLFNGNTVISLPIGPRYSVSSHLSYQFTLTYNAKVWDYETWECANAPQSNCTIIFPNLGSNAGLGWRLSLGRLLPPYYAGVYRAHDSRNDTSWVYEGPAGDEHALGVSSTAAAQVNTRDGMRMLLNADGTRDVEFGSGEVHKFAIEQSVWRLKQMRDRFGNWVEIVYAYDSSGRELSWTIRDSVGRLHVVGLENHAGMSGGWSKGQTVTSLYLQGYGGISVPYSLGITPANGAVPLLTGISLPDGSQYGFTYCDGFHVCNTYPAPLTTMRLPTGGTVSYAYAPYYFVPQSTPCSIASSTGIGTRTISDGSGVRTWNYIQSIGPTVAVQYADSDPCNFGGPPPIPAPTGPIYWSRTSVVAPVDASNHRVRTDHYFSTFSDQAEVSFTIPSSLWLPGTGLQAYGHGGAIGVPPESVRKGPAYIANVSYGGDVDGSNDGAQTATRLLAKEVYGNCDASGNCAAGELLTATYEKYEGLVLIHNGDGGHPIDETQLVSSRTLYKNDRNDATLQPTCGSDCYTQITYSNPNELGQFRTTALESNFSGSQPVTATVQYPSWSTTDLTGSPLRPWLLNTYAETTRSEGGVTARKQFCFDPNTGVVLRDRVLAGQTPAFNDVLRVFSYTNNGDLQFAADYGADMQSLDTGSSLCSIPLPASPWYKAENTYQYLDPGGLSHYTGGIVASSRFYDRVTGAQLSFLSLDRDIDPSTGVVTKSRDSAGVSTSYDYSAKPARLETVTSPSGVVTAYTYTVASGTVGSSWTPAKVDVATTAGADTLRTQYVYDGHGRLQRESQLGPSAWSATETAFDELGRVFWKSQPEPTGSNPPAGPLIAAHKTINVYDPFSRPVTITAPDSKTTLFTYKGVRERRKNHGLGLGSGSPCTATGDADPCVTTVETYDQHGRLTAVTEALGTARENTTNYTYDVGGHLRTVTTGTQTRTFNYDLRGFLTWEQHPELGVNGYATVRYPYPSFDPRGHARRQVTGSDGGLFDLSLTYDSAERLTAVDDSGVLQRPLKRYTYAATNTGSELNKGKLVQAVRYNHPSTGDVTVSETYKYANSFGRPSERQTIVQSANGAALQSFTQSFTYDQLGDVKQIDYPGCDATAPCGGSPPGPVAYTRTRGFLTAAPPYATSITYGPDSSIYQIVHGTAAPITDSYDPDPNGLSRPSMIRFTGFQSCNAPTATVGSGGTIPPGGYFDIPVTLTGTGPWNITWSDGYVQNGQTVSTFNRRVTPASTTTYFIASVSDASCSGTSSGSATVTVSCPAPTATVSGGGTVTPGNSAQIQAVLTGTPPWSLTWSDGYSQPGITTTTVTRPATPASTTTYTITSISDANCSGTSSGSATVTVRLDAPTGFSATTITGSTLQVSLHWNSVQGAGWYQVERATSINGSYVPVGPRVASTSSSDSFGATAPVTYLYRVRSGATFGGVDTMSDPSARDYATVATALFTDDPISSGVTAIRGVHMSQLQQAIDAVRSAAGLTPAWGPSYPPLTGSIFASHNTTARQRLDEAAVILLGHGVSYSGETPATNGVIRGYQVQQIREGVK